MASLDPDAVLQRGYVRVTDKTGHTLTEAAVARREAALTLRFRDGTLDVAVGPVAPSGQHKPRPVAPTKRPAADGLQDDLFG
jgi:exodeoxyribonuclease VII large subunit